MFNNYQTIIDISLALNEQTIIYPGNSPVKIESFKSASGLTYLSNISLGTHTGTHIDAPRHINEVGVGVDKLDLTNLIGPCRVLDFTKSIESIKKEELEASNIQKGERILAKTQNSLRGFTTTYDDYIYLSAEGAKYLAELQISVFAIDYLSIKKRGSSDNRPHTEFLNVEIPIIEGVDLSKVEEGEYYLMALPLKLTGLDGSPIRAVLLK
ncbi:hypothetical protein A3C23_01565 [Candidatus Roizmanbacteria bacterium RIFCSPHIGHO2_02_FULL_37_13b]|uniref:Kynurenine formamidase n=1 Tax=Candidatus Roizmanbacteria bacterium RIFCSPLOWO2_02_FULL_36_11 TaxID=1802071 RepID=A0A1F7JIL2_9BACT|nr:MAG: hypothetical protein A3C23_01565 [Candidatus Roizmanbacteria bacterium RIFCSPHIGHO2_02_FULL_37_13b]OGK55425.1 MAG: hypothetical protein A3H78_06035 [Candidatus Roizmanbacteria bacterium RIFCSPLOWO2_02_FULL_36_11]